MATRNDPQGAEHTSIVTIERTSGRPINHGRLGPENTEIHGETFTITFCWSRASCASSSGVFAKKKKGKRKKKGRRKKRKEKVREKGKKGNILKEKGGATPDPLDRLSPVTLRIDIILDTTRP